MRSILAAMICGVGVSALSPTSLDAATAKGDFAVYGWGARSCKAVVQVLESENATQAAAQMAEWIAGYVSAMNRLTPGTYDVTPVKNFPAFVGLTRGICRSNPDALYESVANAVIQTFSKLKVTQNGPLVEAENEGRRVVIAAEALKKAQEFLAGQGLLEARFADGAYGPKTKAALLGWQEKQKLPKTGLPDIVTLFTIAREMK